MTCRLFGAKPWASYQIHKIAGCACAGNAGNVSPRRRFKRKPLVSDPGMHHGTCVTHVPWCMSGSLTCGDGENVPGIPGACAPAILRIWQEAHYIIRCCLSIIIALWTNCSEIWIKMIKLAYEKMKCRSPNFRSHYANRFVWRGFVFIHIINFQFDHGICIYIYIYENLKTHMYVVSWYLNTKTAQAVEPLPLGRQEPRLYWIFTVADVLATKLSHGISTPPPPPPPPPPPGQNGRRFADDIFKYIFFNEKFCIGIRISLKLVPRLALVCS